MSDVPKLEMRRYRGVDGLIVEFNVGRLFVVLVA